MDFKQEYIEEVKQILKSLEHSIMLLDKQPNNPEEIDNVYRFLHTVKGSAGMFDFKEMERLTHELENIYSDIREDLRVIDENILDLTLHAVDVLNDLIEGNDDGGASQQIIDSITSLRGISEDYSNTTTSKALPQQKEAYSIIFTPTDTIFKRGINLNAILDDLNELSWHETIIHNETIPFAEQIKAKKLISWLEILAISKEGEESIKDIFMFLNESDYKLFKIKGREDFKSEAYSQLIKLSDEEASWRFNKFIAFDQNLFESTETSYQVLPEINKAEVLKDLKSVVEDLVPEVETISIESKTSGSNTKKNSHVNVSTEKLDGLINIVSELVTFRSEMQHLLSNVKDEKITEAVEKLENLTLKLRDSAFNIRLVPINIMNVKLQRLIRSVSKELNKEIDFITEGLDTELDRSIITALEAPLMHIIRNSLDHGIESSEERLRINKPSKGLLKLYSYNSGDHVFIQIQDDGNGIDFKKIKEKAVAKNLLSQDKEYSEKELISVMMSAGFSTADSVTTVSGRGVGMDVVKREINALRGEIDISTEEGLGTIITLRLPLTLTILDTLIVSVSKEKYLIPINEVEYCYEETHSKLFKNNRHLINYENTYIPFVSLRQFFSVEEYPEKETVIIINKNDTRIAIIVDDILGQYQTVYKPLNELIQDIDCFSGASILGDGSTALILNALKLKP